MCLLFILLKYLKGDDNMAIKGQKFREWNKNDKYKMIKPLLNYEATFSEISRKYNVSRGLLSAWINKYRKFGIEGLENKKKPGNPMTKYFTTKNFNSKEEKLEYENMKLRIENEMLKKGFLMKEDGTYVKFMK